MPRIDVSLVQQYTLNDISQLKILIEKSGGSKSKAFQILKRMCHRYNYDLTIDMFDEWCDCVNGGSKVLWNYK